MFLLALVGGCAGEQEPRDAGAFAATTDDVVSVTRVALGGHCPLSAIVEVDTCQELQNMELDLCGRYELTADLDCSTFDAGDDGGFRPVGQCWPWDPFSGEFDGNGHVVSGLTIDRSGTNYVGLFGCIADSEIRDVGLEDASIAGGAVVGSIAGVAYSTDISRVYATGTVTGSIYYVGGLVGWIHDDVTATDSYAQVQVTANGYCGLAFGKSYVASITNVYAAGSLTGCDVGLVGIENDAVMAASYFDCTVAGNCTDALAEATGTLQTPSHYATAGWDLDTVWGFSGPSSYPCLRWQTGCGCQPTAATDADCDGLDDDCSGDADEDFAPQSVSCGVGACAATGSTSCVSGSVQSSCVPGTPAASDSSCDGIDNDCSGAVDEDFVSTPTSCGLGICASTGASACTNGAVVDTCTPGAPGASDASCNGLDDNCNGTADEGFVSFPSSCGVGACLAFGTTSCTNGTVQSDCVPGVPVGTDATCDGVDDDCDGIADEGFATQATDCGVGACSAAGLLLCQNGAITDSCTPAPSAPDDASCNAIDDDCDGILDEDIVVDDHDPCTTDSCDPQGGPVHTALPNGASCSNEDVCDGVELCMAGYDRFIAVGPRQPLSLTNPAAGVVHSLAALGLEPGQRIELRGRGEFSAADMRREPFGTSIFAVFGRLLTASPTASYAAVAAGLPSYTALSRTITGDFVVPAVGVVVTVPASATHLLVGIDDDYIFDNTDVDQDLGVELRTVLETYSGAQTRAIDPASTFLERLNDDRVVAPAVLSLEALGVVPGDRVDVRAIGAWTRGHVGTATTQQALIGAFSSSNVVLSRFSPARIPGALTSDAPSFETTADIAQDFLIPQSGTVVTVPTGASWLVIGVDHETQWPQETPSAERVDGDGDFGLVIQKHGAPAAGCIAGDPLVIDDGVACTSDSCDPETGPSHTPATPAPTCAGLEAECGQVDAGCGIVLECGACTAPEVCGGQQANRCGPPALSASARIQVAREMNVAAPENGGRVVGPPIADERIIDSPATRTWYPLGIVTGPRTFAVELGGEQAPVIDHASFDVSGGYPHTLEVWAAETSNPSQLVLLGQSAGSHGLIAHQLSFAPTRARLVYFVVSPSETNTWSASVDNLRVFTRARQGGVVSLAEGGAQVLAASSSTSPSTESPYDALDFGGSGWRSPNTGSAASLTMRLAPEPVWVDQLELRGNIGNGTGLREVALDLSTRSDGSQLETVIESSEIVSSSVHVIDFEPTLASSARLRLFANTGIADVSLHEARLYSQRLGGAVVPFNDATPIARDQIASWAWDFGDGETSTEQHPLHTYASSGTYDVSLTVTGTSGAQSIARTSYTVLEAPAADFAWAPLVVAEGGAGSPSDFFPVGPLYELYDRTVAAGGHRILQRAWSSGPNAHIEAPLVSENANSRIRFLDDGAYDVTLEVLDSQLLRSTRTHQFDVINVPPVVEAGLAVSGIWGLSTRIGLQTSVSDQGHHDHENLLCRWDFGDGHTLDIADCAYASRTVAHTYEDPGTYAASLTVFDDDTSTTDTVQVVQNRRFAAIVPEPLEATAEDGVFVASARLIDAMSYEPIAGRSLRIGAGAEQHVVVTDAAGYASTSLHFTQLSFVTIEYEFEGDARYEEALLPIDYLVREGDTEPQPALEPTAGQESTHFVIGFPQNYYNIPYPSDRSFVGVMITSQVETNAVVSIPGLGFSESIHVLPGQSMAVDLPVGVRMGVGGGEFDVGDSGLIEDKGVEIESEHPVSVYGFDFITFSTDGFSAIPVEQLGTEYFALAYSNEKKRFYQDPGGTQVGIVATEDDTEITITPTEDVAPGPQLPNGAPKGVPFTVVLDRLQTFQIVAHHAAAEHFEDLTGTHIASSKPIAVLGGHVCIAIGGNSACNHLVEQLPPIESWGTRFITGGMRARAGNSGRPNGEYLRVLAASDDTQVRVDGELVATLARGEHVHLPTGVNEGHEIIATKPVLVAQYIKAFTQAGPSGARQDPFMAIVPAVDQYSTRYELAVAEPNMIEYIADRYQDGLPPSAAGTVLSLEDAADEDYWADSKINIIAPSAEVGGIRVDGAPVQAAWLVIGGGEYAMARVPVEPGHHRLSHAKPGVRFAAFAYGFNHHDGFGYPAGLSLGQRACEVSTPRPLDGIDNDCDGIRDEELLNGVDDDGDGVEDEDLNAVATPNRTPEAYSTAWDQFNAGYVGGADRVVTERFALPGFDADGDPLTWTLVGSPAAVSLAGNIVSVVGTLPPATVRAVASDGTASSLEATLSLTRTAGDVNGGRLDCETNRSEGVRRLCNEPPYMFGGSAAALTIPIPSGQVVHYTSRVHAHDLDKDEVRYALISGPQGLEVDPISGIVRWAIDSGDVGTHHVHITCSDYRRGQGPLSQGNFSSFMLKVETSGNSLPIISSTPLATAEISEAYSYQIVASDPEGGALQYQLLAGPPGMQLSPTGLVTWTPSHLDVGTHSAAIRVVDAQNAGQSQRWTITVAGGSLRIVSSPPLQGAYDEDYTYSPQLVDESGGSGPYEWVMLARPLGMTISPSTGRLTWTPAHNQLGRHITAIQVDGPDGAFARQYFTINVEELSRAPEITSEPPASVVLGGLYFYDVNATDYGQLDVLEYELVTAPPGMVIDALSGVIQWIPEALASEAVTVRVTDTSGLSDVQTFLVTVVPDDQPPTVNIIASPERAAPGQPITLTVQATDNAAVASRALEIEGLPAALDGSYQYVFSSTTPGVYVVTATATDASDNVGTTEIAIGVTDAADTTLPEVAITQPADNVDLTYIHDIVASVSDANLIGYRNQIRRSGSTTWRTIQRTYTRHANGVIGQVDTTLLENGFYELRIVAEDANGQTQEVTRSVRVNGQAKVGVVTLDFVDAVIPAAGIPIVVGRNYDSRFKEKGDFGYGWRLTARGGKVQHNNLHPGKHWFITEPEGSFGFPCTDNYETKEHLTEVKLSEREWYLFRPVLIHDGESPVGGMCRMSYTYEFVDGSAPGAELSVVGNNRVLGPNNAPLTGDRVNGYDVFHELSEQLYEPEAWSLTLADGRTIQLDKAGIRSIQDLNGNAISIHPTGIAHSDGGGVVFERDLQGRISRVVDAEGRSTSYGYDLNGDLVRVTDANGDDTRFTYHADPAHHLDEIRGPDGKPVAALDYDGSGRLARSCDGDRACTVTQYDLVARSMTQLDSTSRLTTSEYDARGNVTSQTNELGHTTSFEYDGNDNLTRAEGPDGSVATYTYDSRGNMLTRVLPYEPGEDPADFTYLYTYDARSNRETVTLPSGGVIDYDYDARGNLTATKDGAGDVIESRAYYFNGKLATRTDRFGTVHYQVNYAANGQPREVIDSFGESIAFTYDLLGNVISRTERGATTTTTYDGIGRPLVVDYGNGATVEYEYRSERDKRWTAISGPTFGRVERTFDDAGRIASWKEPNGDEQRRAYDAAGRVIEETDALGNRTTYVYDVAGRLESITDVTLAATTTFERDSSGRVVKTIDGLGHETETDYLSGGRLASTTNARGYTTTFDRTPLQSSITDALTRTTVSSMSSYGLPTGTSYPGGSSTGSAYRGTTRLDGAQSFPTSFEDEQSRERSFSYDTRSGLTAATDLAGEPWAYQYTATRGTAIRYDVFSGEVSLGHHDGGASAYAGGGGGTEYRDVATVGGSDGSFMHHLSRVESPTGEVTEFVRGEGGRIQSIEYPDGGEKVISYGADGQPNTVTLPQGTTLTFQHDDALREVSRTSSVGEMRAFTYGVGDRIETMTDATGTTTYHYDTSGRFTGMTYPHGGSVRYTRDVLGRTTHVRVKATASAVESVTQYAYDENGNLETVTDPLNGVTQYVYDQVDRLTSRTLPNGVTTTYGYDDRDRVLSVVHRNASNAVLASATYVRSVSGEPTRITREDGSYVELTYDAALRVETETYRNASGTVLDAVEYEYDADGNRTSKTSLSGGFESYAYGAGFKLASIATTSGTETYGYDGGGRQVSVTRSGVARTLEYNSDDKLTRVVDGSSEVVEYAYDGAGRRVSMDDGAGVRRYLVAPNMGDGFETPQAVTDASGNVLARYVFAGEHPTARVSASGQVEYYLQDAMGSVIGMANASGASTATIKYDSFGNVTSAVGASAGIDSVIGTDFRYHGMQLDAASGLYHVRARTYDARTGRFTSRDPVSGYVARPETINPYVFSHNSPHLWRDPSGAFGLIELAAVVVVVAILAQTSMTYDTMKQVKNRFLDQPPPGVNINANLQYAYLVRETFSRARAWLWFYNQVKTGGDWDYKNRYRTAPPPGWTPSDENGYDPYERFGNFHFGAIGRAVGFDTDKLLQGAGTAQWFSDISDFEVPRTLLPGFAGYYGDDPRDQRDIILGVNFAVERGYGN